MLLAADVGNTNVKLGIFDGDNLKFKLRFSTDENKTSDELAVELFTFLQIYNIDAKSIDGTMPKSAGRYSGGSFAGTGVVLPDSG